jgi:hypothetical protein
MAMAPANYSGLANLMNLQGVGVNPTSQLAYVPSKDLMTRYQTIPNPSTGIPQAMGVTGMAEGGMPSQQYPMQEEAMELANRGRYGDTTLVHMTPGEVQGLSSLGQLTINPDTGLPEAFSLKSIIPMAASIVGGMVAGPAGAAIGSGLGTLVTGGSAEQALLGAAMSFGMGYAMQGFGGSIFGDLGAGAAGAGAAGAAGAGAGAGAGAAGSAATEAALQQSLSTFGTGVGGNIGSAINPSTGIPTIGAQLGSSFTPVTDSLFPFNPSSGVIGDVGSAAIPQSAIPSAARIGPTTTAAKFLDTTAATGQTTPNFFERNIYNSAENVGGKGEGLLESYFSPNRSSIQPTKAEITKAYADRAAELQLPSVDNLSEQARADVFKSLQPSFLQKYGPLGAVGIGGLALTGAFDEEEPEQQQMAKREVEYPRYTLAGGEERNPETAKEIQSRMLAGGVRPSYFGERRYVRNAAEGGLIGLQQGGMPTPQAPSAMAGMLAQPQPQQPVMPQQPQPSMPMPPQQMGSGVTPLPDQQKEFMKLMDMEDQLQSQKRSQSTQALASLIGLGTNFASNQYPQTSPSGQAVQPPPTPPMNYGSQVNLGATGGFAQGGMPSQSQPYFEGQVQGPGDGQSDEVAFRVDGGQIDGAMLSPQEYVLAADVVSAIGNGSSDAGAAKLDQFMKGVRQDAYGTTKQMQPFNNQGLTNLVA